MKLHREGHTTLRNEILILSLANYITFWNSEWIFWYCTLPISILILSISFYFFRIPKRLFERKKGNIYSPCDGKIVVIETTTENEYYEDKRIQISIFMSPLNIHNNLYPISGVVSYIKYHSGKFLVAWRPKASTDNERSTVVIENHKISILIRQIAGAIAKRIITYSKLGESVQVSDEFGFIKFGSRVDLFLPIGTKINVEINQKVKGGKSIIASY